MHRGSSSWGGGRGEENRVRRTRRDCRRLRGEWELAYCPEVDGGGRGGGIGAKWSTNLVMSATMVFPWSLMSSMAFAVLSAAALWCDVD